jgi:hypothetical protein
MAASFLRSWAMEWASTGGASALGTLPMTVMRLGATPSRVGLAWKTFICLCGSGELQRRWRWGKVFVRLSRRSFSRAKSSCTHRLLSRIHPPTKSKIQQGFVADWI